MTAQPALRASLIYSFDGRPDLSSTRTDYEVLAKNYVTKIKLGFVKIQLKTSEYFEPRESAVHQFDGTNLRNTQPERKTIFKLNREKTLGWSNLRCAASNKLFASNRCKASPFCGSRTNVVSSKVENNALLTLTPKVSADRRSKQLRLEIWKVSEFFFASFSDQWRFVDSKCSYQRSGS